MRVRVLLFARARELAGAGEVAVAVPAGTTVGELRAALTAAHPVLADVVARSAVAVDEEFADDGMMIEGGAVAAGGGGGSLTRSGSRRGGGAVSRMTPVSPSPRDGASGGSSGSSVDRKRSASGPSRMLARLRRAIR